MRTVSMTSLKELGRKFLHTLRKIYGVMMGNTKIDAEEGDEQKLGRRTIEDGIGRYGATCRSISRKRTSHECPTTGGCLVLGFETRSQQGQ